MDRRMFVLSVASSPLVSLCSKDPIVQDSIVPIVQDSICYLQVRQGRVLANFNGHNFEPKIQKHEKGVTILEDLPSVVHLDIESLKN